jgi:hypothetical protein
VSGPVAVPAPAKDLTVNKILAGAGAAATTAVLGSFFGAAGTVTGAALGSVASTLATTLYQRSLDRTRDTLVARIRPVNGRGSAAGEPGEVTMPMPRIPGGEGTVELRVEPAVAPAPPRRRRLMWVGATVLVFVLGLLAVTGIEWIKGSTITSGDSGTSVGRVLGADRAARPTEAPSSPSETTGESTTEPTSTPEPSAEPSNPAEPDVAGTSPAEGSGTTATSDAPGLLPGPTTFPGGSR